MAVRTEIAKTVDKKIQNSKEKNLSETLDACWQGLHKTGGIAAIIIAIILVGEVFVYAVIPNPTSATECMQLFIKNPLAGLLHFDLLGMISYLLFIPLMLSLYRVIRRNNESIPLIATVLFFVGIAVFFATNTSFSILSLSKQYSLAATEAERAILLSSCQTMITLFRVQAFMVSYLIVSAAWFMISIVMLKSKYFTRLTAWMGILAGASGILAEILENTSKLFLPIAIAFYFAAIVFLFIWVIFTGRQLLNIVVNMRKENDEKLDLKID